MQGIQERAGQDVEVSYAPGIRPAQRTFPSMFDMWGDNAPVDPVDFDDAAELDRAVDTGARSRRRGGGARRVAEHDRRGSVAVQLELPGEQLALLQAVATTGTPIVLLVMNGRPLDLRWAADNVPAILDIWYPGTQGGAAVADLLFGDVAPGGKLPFSWPRTVGQVPMIYSHTISHEPDNQGRRYWDEESTPLFPFGYGLSYGRFEYTDLTVDRDRIRRRRDGHRVGDGHQRRASVPVTRWPSSTSTSGTGPRRDQSVNSRASSASPSPPASHRRCASHSAPTNSATGTPPQGTG